MLLERAAREMVRVDELFRPYVGPPLADRLQLEPSIAELGGREAEVAVLFADLAGFTSFSEGRSPMEVVQRLNAYWATAVPIVTEGEGGLIERFAGDAILVVFNAMDDQPDHAVRAVRAARSMQRVVAETSDDHPEWPRFRIGINSGPTALGNVGAGADLRGPRGPSRNRLRRHRGVPAILRDNGVMAVPSTMLALGTRAPSFELPDVVTGRTVSIRDFDEKPALLVMFLCRHCPYVKHVRDELGRLGRDFADSELAIVAIGANDPTAYPEDAPEGLAEDAREAGYVFPYLFDETQEVAKAYTAACTPDFFLFDANRALVYRGQLDSSRPGNDLPVTGEDLRAAIDAVLSNGPVAHEQRASIGCGIKWRAGNEPAYA